MILENINQNKTEMDLIRNDILEMKSHLSHFKNELNHKIMELKSETVRKLTAFNENIEKNRVEISNLSNTLRSEINNLRQNFEETIDKIKIDYKNKIE